MARRVTEDCNHLKTALFYVGIKPKPIMPINENAGPRPGASALDSERML